MKKICNTDFSTFCQILTPTKSNYLNLIQVGWDKSKPNYTYSNYRDMFIFHYVKSGFGNIETNSKIYTLTKGDAFIVRPNILTVQTVSRDEPWEIGFFAFNGNFAREIVEKTVFQNNIVAVPLRDDKIWESIVSIALELHKNDYGEIQIMERLFRLLSYFEQKKATFIHANEKTQTERYISSVHEFISYNFSKPIRISDIADQLNVNRSHLYRIFKKETGISLQDYLISVRMNAARTMLADTDFAATTISSLVGYSHYPTFFKLFRKYTGVSPQQYRIDCHK